MSRSSTLASVQIDVSEKPEPVRRVAPETPFRILVAGDFSGGAGRNRRPIPVDRDNFDEVLKLLADGLSIKEVAARLDRSVKTAEVHTYNLMQKLDVHDRSELIRYAIVHRLVQLPVFEDLAPSGSRDHRHS